MLLHDHCEAVSSASTRDEFQAALVQFANDLGFRFMSASAVYDMPHAPAKFVTAHNTPASYLPLFDAPIGCFDPVMQHCKHSVLPIAWDQSTYVRAGCGEKWEEMAPCGYQTGICMALHLPHGRHFVLGVDGDRALPKQQKQLARMVADLVSVLMSAQESAFLLLPFKGASDPDAQCQGHVLASGRQGDRSGLLIRSDEFSTPVRAELVEALVARANLRQAQGERLKLHQTESISRSILKARFHKPVH
jgi:Autoinducer binding domain